MIAAAIPLLDRLKAEAEQADKAEDAYRREAAQRIKALEQERSFAYRRLNLLRAVAGAMAEAEQEKEAVAAAERVLRDKLGWASDSAPRLAVLRQFDAVASAMHGAAEETAALSRFEAWYQEAHGSPFWILFEHYMRETPLVDF
jgi:hypothetical protein